jgi:hypothetical protein
MQNEEPTGPYMKKYSSGKDHDNNICPPSHEFTSNSYAIK